MKFDEALTLVFDKKEVTLSYWKPHQYIHLLHNTIADETGNNYRPSVTELNSNEWKINIRRETRKTQ